MSILNNFKNPWESGGALDSGVLGNHVLEGNVLTSPIREEQSQTEWATKSDKIKAGNLMILIIDYSLNKYTKDEVQDKFLKSDIESNNTVWDYVTTLDLGFDISNEWIPNYIEILKKNNLKKI